MTTLIDAIENEQNETLTENDAVTYKSTLSFTLDYFGLGSALRTRNEKDIVKLFSIAFAEDNLIALKILFYSRDCRGGQGERRSFRFILGHLAKKKPDVVVKNLDNIVYFGRWDDLFCLKDYPIWNSHVLPYIKEEWYKEGKPSLFWKWVPSNNTSSKETRALAEEIRAFLNISPKEYRKTLSAKRKQIWIVETDMCSNKWNEIPYKKVPSKANLNYKDAFKKHDAVRYNQYIEDVKSGKTTINSSTLYPYDIVKKCLNRDDSNTLDVLWKALPDYMEGNKENGIVVADVSGSMHGLPMAVSISLALYISERTEGIFKNRFITFSEDPELVKVKGNEITTKVKNLENSAWGSSTNLESVFNLILDTAVKNSISEQHMPKKLYIISDMEFDCATGNNADKTLFKTIKSKYAQAGYEMPDIVFWNVNARNDQSPIKKDDKGVCLVSGCSPSILKSLLSGRIISPQHIMLDTINAERYNKITI